MRFLMVFLILCTVVSFLGCNQNDCEADNNANCACYEIYAPVCGCDDVTYSNDCHAECAGIMEYTEGACN